MKGVSTGRAQGSTDPLLAGQVIGGKYELIEVAGVGGMATVWRAVQRGPGRFRRTVAVKHMHPHLADQGQYRDMFFEEARVGGVLSDPNLAQVQDFIEDRGQLYLVLEWVDGIDLATYNRYVVDTRQTTRWELVTAVGIGLLRGLAAAHEHTNERGELATVLHRDVSPHNVLISVKGPARLIDFGLALASDRESAPTPPGTAKGKLAYLSPEVARGEPPTPAADQFAAASVLWESLVGRKCFDGADQAEVFRRLTTAEVEPLAQYRGDVPKQLVRIIARAHEADPADRFPSTRAMAVELGRVLKAAQSRVDLYSLLAGTVVDARAALHMGGRTQAPAVAEAMPEDESQVEVPLLLRTAWRRLRSHIPFLGNDAPPPRRLTTGGSERTPTTTPTPTPTSTSEIRRRAAHGVLRLSPGTEVEAGDLRLRLVPTANWRTPTDPVIQLEVTCADATDRLGLEVPGQIVHAGHLLSALSRRDGTLSLRTGPVRAGVAMLMFPYVPIVIGELTLEVTGVGDSRVFLSLSLDGRPTEHLIVAASNTAPAVVDRNGYRITVEGVSSPWVTVRVDETDDPEELLDDADVVEV